jgi:hypothetical protein
MNHDRQQTFPGASSDEAFDRAMRARHHEAVASLSPRVQAQLQQRLRALRTPMAHTRWRGPAWGLALACSVVLVFTVGIHRHASNDVPAPVATTGSNDAGELVATLDEAPDLYLWLASDDANSMLSE